MCTLSWSLKHLFSMSYEASLVGKQDQFSLNLPVFEQLMRYRNLLEWQTLANNGGYLALCEQIKKHTEIFVYPLWLPLLSKLTTNIIKAHQIPVRENRPQGETQQLRDNKTEKSIGEGDVKGK